MTGHERIYLEPSPGADEDYGRQWCQHNVWDEATEYVRADLHLAIVEERDRLREALRAEHEFLSQEARRYASFYSESSDGRNTFIIFAEMIERRSADQERQS
ncbi:hypothetical protein ELG76_04005 [Rhizobium leguminosarum]|uniref:hypothetical protein n=1 Tax=Rhizobium leguminosarum TaxID=384 RepID=UPI001030EB06|nr:hypothetical protein [Rhizobium leguminosarum]TBG78585.1 hypothetical protein ELG76_04005 [Rhizobium leguminosarum]